MTEKFPNLPSDELAMLATVEAASNAGQLTVIREPPPTRDHAIRLAAMQALVAKGWIEGAYLGDIHVFYTQESKVFHADSL